MTLLTTLLDYAASPKGHEEDPITEILAWVLDHDARLLGSFLDLLPQQGPAIPTTPPTVRTQVAEGTGRYDLVLAWSQRRSLSEIMSADDPPWEVRRYFFEGYGALKGAGLVDALRAGVTG